MVIKLGCLLESAGESLPFEVEKGTEPAKRQYGIEKQLGSQKGLPLTSPMTSIEFLHLSELHL